MTPEKESYFTDYLIEGSKGMLLFLRFLKFSDLLLESEVGFAKGIVSVDAMIVRPMYQLK